MKPITYRIRPACSSRFKFHISSFTFLTALCLLTSVLCPSSRAGGSWLINGKRTEVVEVESSATDFNALYTDGSRAMQAPLVFDPSVSSQVSGLFKAYVPWDAEYDFFAFNPTHETVVLSPTVAIGFEAAGLSMHSGVIEFLGESSVVDFMEHRLGGGWWLQDVMDDPKAVIHKEYADNRYVRSSVSNENLTIFRYADDPQQGHKKITLRAAAPGVGDVSVVVDPEEGFVVYSGTDVAARISSSTIRLGASYTEMEIVGSEVYLYADATAPDHALNRRTGDTRYIQRTEGITANHAIQAGDVLQIQNGIITAINP